MNKNIRIVSAIGALLTIALALFLSGQLSAGEEDAKVVKAVRSLGGNAVRDDKAKGKPIIGVYLGNTKVTDAGMNGRWSKSTCPAHERAEPEL